MSDNTVAWVERFLDMNYGSCNCGEPDGCPGNYYEAVTIVEGVLERAK